ncbi:MAG: hypothetical protein KA746_00950 [Pyrinomonadaceae bacterium]|nr:hypothetical protein [Pyrinomonadaceae bacterium]MBP6213565.1 hypothetical protein [Pyrinomonadaceae bacterium]
MDTYQIEIIEPGAKKLLDDMANMNLITVRPLGQKNAFKKLLDKMRSSNATSPTLDEITAEVESVRQSRYERKSDDQSNTGHKSLD